MGSQRRHSERRNVEFRAVLRRMYEIEVQGRERRREKEEKERKIQRRGRDKTTVVHNK